MSRVIQKQSARNILFSARKSRQEQPNNFVLLAKTFRIAMAINIVFLLTMTFGALTFAEVKKAFAAQLKSIAVIDKNVIHASDLFDGLTERSDKVVGPAPLPGRDMTLNARTLLRIAMALDLSWRPESGRELVTIRRAATIIDNQMIETTITDRITDSGLTDNFQINFSRDLPFIALPSEQEQTVEIGHFAYDPFKETFEAELIAPSLDNPLEKHLVQGKIIRLTQIPVLKKTMQNGQSITASQIDWIEMPAYKLQHDLVLSADDLLGMTPRRMALAGQPLRHNELQEPLLIKRGDRIRITYSNGFIQLVAEGKALENGARGDRIRVVNYSSNRTIDAFVTGRTQVEVN